jgi:hypothetical protein
MRYEESVEGDLYSLRLLGKANPELMVMMKSNAPHDTNIDINSSLTVEVDTALQSRIKYRMIPCLVSYVFIISITSTNCGFDSSILNALQSLDY